MRTQDQGVGGNLLGRIMRFVSSVLWERDEVSCSLPDYHNSLNIRLCANPKANPERISDLCNADAIIVATHSQRFITSTHLLDRLIRDGHVVTSRNQDPNQNKDQQDLVMPVGLGVEAEMFPASIGLGVESERRENVCCLALCGIRWGPLMYLSCHNSTLSTVRYFKFGVIHPSAS